MPLRTCDVRWHLQLLTREQKHSNVGPRIFDRWTCTTWLAWKWQRKTYLVNWSVSFLNCARVRASYFSVRVINVWNSLPADRVDFSSFAAFKQTIKQIDFSQFLFGYDNWICIGRVTMLWLWMCFLLFSCILCFCILFYIVGSCKCRVGYPALTTALLSSSYFERINDDDDEFFANMNKCISNYQIQCLACRAI